MKYSIAIVEDNMDSANKIIRYLKQFEKETNYKFEYKHYIDGINLTSDYKPIYDIAILDIAMKFQDGMKTAELIRKYDQSIIIIFITNMSQYAIKGYKVNALSFLLKPLPYFAFKEELMESIIQINKNREEKFLLVPSRFGIKKISTQEILFIESIMHDLKIHTLDNVYTFRATLKTYEKQLVKYNFNRCNNPYLVNLLHVTGVEGDFVIIDEKHKLKISRGRKKQFMDELSKYVGRKR